MRQHPWRIVAVQAALSMAIIVIVYLTLLRPDGGGPLDDVEAPDAGNGTLELARPPEGGRGERRAGEGRLPATGPVTSLAGGLLITGRGAESQRTDTPSFDQYSGTLAKLSARLGVPQD